MTKAASPSRTTTHPSFTLGVTGNMDPDFEALGEHILQDRLETLLLFFRLGWDAPDPRPTKSNTLGTALSELAASPYDYKGLENWPGVPAEAELILLSSFAPGADTITAETVRDLNALFPAFQARVRAALPFPPDLYRKLSTFVLDSSQPTEAEKTNQETFSRWIDSLPEEDVFVTWLGEDVDENPALLAEKLRSDSEQTDRCNLRYQVAGEYVATHSDILIGIYDDRFDSASAAGSNDIVESKRRGPTPGLLPSSEALDGPKTGPVFHLYHPRIKTRIQARQEAREAPPENGRKTGPIRILQPYELGPEDSELRAQTSNVWELQQLLETASPEHRDRWIAAFSDWQQRGNQLAISRVSKFPIRS